MPELSPQELNAFQTLLDGLCPGLSLSLAEQVNHDLNLETLSVASVALPTLQANSQTQVQTTFTLSAPTSAENVFLVPQEVGLVLVDLMNGGDGSAVPEMLTDPQITQLAQAMSGLAKGLATALTNQGGDLVDLDACSTTIGNIALPPMFARDGNAVQAVLSLRVEGILDTELTFLLIPEYVQALTAGATETADEAEAAMLSEDEIAAMLSDLGDDSLSSSPAPTASTASSPAQARGNAPFANFPQGDANPYPRGLELIMDIPLDVTVELGRVRMLIRDVLELASGSIVELERVAGEPVDLLVNGRLIAKGEVVVIEDNFGLRLTEIISPADRVANLGRGR